MLDEMKSTAGGVSLWHVHSHQLALCALTVNDEDGGKAAARDDAQAMRCDDEGRRAEVINEGKTVNTSDDAQAIIYNQEG